jgi:hypothetical protein
MGGHHEEGHVTYPRNMRMEKTGRMEASSEEGQGPEGAVEP